MVEKPPVESFFTMTIRQIVRILKKFQPQDVWEARHAGLKLRYVAEGCSREVYRVHNTNVVLKFPKPDIDKGALRHAREEMAGFRSLRYSHLRKYLPKIYHFNELTGVIAVKKYKRGWAYHAPDVEKLRSRLQEFFGLEEDNTDYSGDNFGRDCYGNLKILDLGIN